MAKKPNKDEYILKSDVQRIIQNYIRAIQMNDYSNDEGISQLYNVMNMIEKMPTQFTTMRNATSEERKSIQKHIEEISQPTGVNFWDICTPVLPAETVYNTVPKACENCANHPKNGGNGYCNCILGQPLIT